MPRLHEKNKVSAEIRERRGPWPSSCRIRNGVACKFLACFCKRYSSHPRHVTCSS